MNITLITVGKIKEKYFTDAISEYTKRLSKYCRLQMFEVADEKTPDKSSPIQDELIKKKEAERIRHYIREDAYIITLEINGNAVDSVE